MDKLSITRAFEALGPERVERGMVAFNDYHAPGDMERCFLGRATYASREVRVARFLAGIPFMLLACAWEAIKVDGHLEWSIAFRLAYGIPYAVCVTEAFDIRGTRRLLKELALEWLEQNRTTRRSLSSISSPATMNPGNGIAASAERTAGVPQQSSMQTACR